MKLPSVSKRIFRLIPLLFATTSNCRRSLIFKKSMVYTRIRLLMLQRDSAL